MDTKISCPHCQQPLEVSRELLGQTVECPTCHGYIKLPKPDSPTIPKKIIIPKSVASNPKDAVVTNYSYPNVNDSRATTNSSNTILASGSGKWNSSTFVTWIVCIIGAVVSFATSMYAADYLEKQAGNLRNQVFQHQFNARSANPFEPNRTNYSETNQAVDNLKQAASVMRSLAILPVLAFLLIGVVHHRRVAGSHIQVYGNEIVGKGSGKRFRLAYSQITSVDVSGNTIIIHASGVQYKCYLKNPANIQQVIVSQLQRITNWRIG